MTTTARFRPVLLALLFTLPCGACASGREPLYPVSGQVFYEGKPVEGATIVLHPLNSAEANAPTARGRTDSEGSFTLGTYAAGDGAPAGEYGVAIIWIPADAKRNPKTGSMPNRLPDRYARPETSKLTATVQSGPTELPPFRLTK